MMENDRWKKWTNRQSSCSPRCYISAAACGIPRRHVYDAVLTNNVQFKQHIKAVADLVQFRKNHQMY